jgi:hypothetical protein
MAHYANPSFELTGHVLQLSIPKQVNIKIWSRELILEVSDWSEPGEGHIKIEFSKEQIHLLDAVQEGDLVTVDFTILGLQYDREDRPKHSVKLLGQHIKVRKPTLKKVQARAEAPSISASDSTPNHQDTDTGFAPNTIRLGSKMLERPVPFPKARKGEEPPF